MPRDWALRPSYDTRVAIINALYACGENIQKLMPVLLTEAVRRDRWALSLTLHHSPVSCHTAWQGLAYYTAAQQWHTCSPCALVNDTILWSSLMQPFCPVCSGRH